MIHLPQLITDLGLILAAAAVTTLIFKKIKQPLVLGYIIAGLLVGPHFHFLPTVAEEKSIAIWAEIGVIFLLFNLGLEFSFKKLAKVGGTASVTGITEAVIMLLIGYITGHMMGWSAMDSIFLGGILAISSTTIIIRAFEELRIKHKKFAGLVFGVLIVEDLVAILLLVILSTLAASNQFAGTDMLISILKFAFFLILWFLGGIFLVPTFLRLTKNLMRDETLLIVSLALCLLMVILAVQVGFSPALGAFIMGSILAETTLAEEIEHLTKSVKDLFASVFFISVGMMIDPQVLSDYALPIAIITLATIFGKLISTMTGALLSGQPLRIAVQAGMSLAQIGEFSFIIATLGLTLKVTSDFLYPIAVAVSAVTTFTTPYLIKLSDPLANFLEKNLPRRWVSALNKYSTSTAGITTTNDWKVLLKAYIMNAVIHSVMLIGILFAAQRFIHPFITDNIDNGIKGTAITLVLSFILMAPFLWAFALRRIQRKAYSHLWLNKKYSRGPLVALEVIRIGLALFYIAFLINIFLDTFVAITIALASIILAFVIFSKRLQGFYNRIETRFLINLNDRENMNGDKSKQELVPWDTHLSELEVSAESILVGKTLKDVAMREKYGLNIAMIERGKLKINSPGPNDQFMPHDKLTLIGTDEQLEKFSEVFKQEVDQSNGDTESGIELNKIVLNSQSPVLGLSIKDSRIRETTQGLIVGIERNKERFVNPESGFVLQTGDVMWIVGNRRKITAFLQPPMAR